MIKYEFSSFCLLVYFLLLIVDHCDACCCSGHVGSLSIPNYLFTFILIFFSRNFRTITSENIWSPSTQTFKVSANIHFICVFLVAFYRARSFLLSNTGFQMFGHFRSKNVVSTDVTLLKNLLLFGC